MLGRPIASNSASVQGNYFTIDVPPPCQQLLMLRFTYMCSAYFKQEKTHFWCYRSNETKDHIFFWKKKQGYWSVPIPPLVLKRFYSANMICNSSHKNTIQEYAYNGNCTAVNSSFPNISFQAFLWLCNSYCTGDVHKNKQTNSIFLVDYSGACWARSSGVFSQLWTIHKAFYSYHRFPRSPSC